jgi:hypothetical protein
VGGLSGGAVRVAARLALIALGGLAVGLAGPTARAAEYEVFVDVADEAALRELLDSGQISEATFAALVDLSRRRVDLATADRDELYALPNLTWADVDAILAHRAAAGGLADPVELVAAGVLTRAQLLAIAPFLRVPPRRSPGASEGWARTSVVGVPGGQGVPPAALVGGVRVGRRWSAGGALVVTGQRLGAIAWDAARGGLLAEPPAARPALPRLYVRYERGGVRAILGSYRIGFGERLTFDDTAGPRPAGLVADDDLQRPGGLVDACREARAELEPACRRDERFVARDPRWSQTGLFGAAVRVRDLRLGAGALELAAFGSYASRSLYQYELYDRARCADPRRDDPACAAPWVYKQPGEPDAPTSRYAYSMLPDVFDEATAGAHVGWSPGTRTRVGATAYASSVRWRVPGADLDFQEHARWRRGGAFGAVGVDAAVGTGGHDLGVEVTRSFDAVPADQGGGGGFAAVLRGTTARPGQELEVTLRWYDVAFANPYTRAVAAADEREGQRARDEAGVRVAYAGRATPSLAIRARGDVWVAPSTRTPKAALVARVDWDATGALGLALWGAWRDGDLADSACGASPAPTPGSAPACPTQGLSSGARARVAPWRGVTLAAQIAHGIVDGEVRRHALSTWLSAAWVASDALTLRARTRWRDEDLGAARAPSTWASFAEVEVRLARGWHANLRWDVLTVAAVADATAPRPASVQQWLWVELTARF